MERIRVWQLSYGRYPYHNSGFPSLYPLKLIRAWVSMLIRFRVRFRVKAWFMVWAGVGNPKPSPKPNSDPKYDL